MSTELSIPIDEDADPFPPGDLVGDWLTNSGYVKTFFEDGSWTVVWPESPDSISDAGTWQLLAATVILTSELEDSKTRCDPGDVGYYELAYAAEGGIDLSPLDDDCIGRFGELRHGLSPTG